MKVKSIRPKYETAAHKKAERAVAKYLEGKLACDFVESREFASFDYFMCRNRHVIGIAEIKCLTSEYKKFPNAIVARRKFDALRIYLNSALVKCFGVFWRYNNGDIYSLRFDLGDEEYFERTVITRKDRCDPYDTFEVVLIPNERLKFIGNSYAN